ncbi:MAG: Smr/MutS family protein [Polyangiaceae bacterium]
MSGVATLEAKSHRIPRTASEVDKRAPLQPREDADAPARESMRALVAGGLRFEVSDDGERVEGRRLELDPRELRRLRRGEYAIDGKLDLHGLGADEARGAGEAVGRHRRAAGDRVVLVVHGKGKHSPRGAGVLRGEIGAWLSQGGAARDVAAFASAGEIRVPRRGDQAEEDVPGAVYVLLAR